MYVYIYIYIDFPEELNASGPGYYLTLAEQPSRNITNQTDKMLDITKILQTIKLDGTESILPKTMTASSSIWILLDFLIVLDCIKLLNQDLKSNYIPRAQGLNEPRGVLSVLKNLKLEKPRKRVLIKRFEKHGISNLPALKQPLGAEYKIQWNEKRSNQLGHLRLIPFLERKAQMDLKSDEIMSVVLNFY
jgi:hypothetical protein